MSILASILAFFTDDGITSRLLAVVCAVSIACALWLYVAMTKAEADAAMTRADNARLLESVSAKDTAIAALRSDISDRDAIIVKRDARISELHTAATTAAIAIQGAANDKPECDIDARLPRSLSDPLRVLYANATGRDSAASDHAGAARNAVPAKADAGTPDDNDSTQPRTVDGKTGHLGG